MLPPPLVTVVIATYNRSNVLPYSIGSALNQDCTDIEVLVIGDGCTDDSRTVVEGMDDPRVRWIGLSRNSGHQSIPNNAGLRAAQGEFIAYLGHDDLWLPHHLQVCIDRLRQGADLAYGLTLMIAEDKSVMLAPTNRHYSPGHWIPPSCMVHRKSVTDTIGGWKHHTQVRRDPEINLWRRAFESGYKFTLVPRLSAIKIPAALRKDVYKTRDADEQAYWFKRIQEEPDLEQGTLALYCVGLHNLDPARRASLQDERTIEEKRKYKGL